MEIDELKPIVEAMVFAADEPLTFKAIKDVLKDVEKNQIQEVIDLLNKEYEDAQRAFQIKEIANGWQMQTKEDFAPWLSKLYSLRKKGRLSKPALESLSVVAYKQPVTRAEVEAIRGVNVDGVMALLMEKDFIKILGRKDSPGRPIIYGTTDKFLEYFGLVSVKDLPPIEEFVKEEEPIPEELLKQGEENIEGQKAEEPETEDSNLETED